MSQEVCFSEVRKKRSNTAMFLLGIMFFIFGFNSWINSILVPYFKTGFELNHFQSYLIVFAMYLSYLIMSLPASHLLKKTGYKRGIMYGFFTVSLGALLFLPAASYRSYAIFLLGQFVMGLGLATLQTAANPYVTVIGPIDTSVRRMAIMGIVNKFAGLIAPLVFATVVFKVSDATLLSRLDFPGLSISEKDFLLGELVRRVMVPYGVYAIFLFFIGLVFRYSNLPEIDLEKENESESTGQEKGSVFAYPYLVLGVLAMFLHISTQVVTIDTIISYAGTMGINMIDAKVFPSYTLALVILGNVLGILLIPRIISQLRVFQVCCVLGLLLSLGVVSGSCYVDFLGFRAQLSIWFLVGIGLANSLIYAGIWPLAIRQLGKYTKTGSSLLVMALFGNAVTPLLYGWIGDSYSLHTAYAWILLPSFSFLVYYSFSGYRLTSWTNNKK